jgi:hypothetical protein
MGEITLLVGFILVIRSTIMAQSNWREGAGHLKLKDRLDRPEDGYCLVLLNIEQ